MSPLKQQHQKNSPQLFFSVQRGRGACAQAGWSTLPWCACRWWVYCECLFCQHLSWSISEHSVSMSESYSEWPVGSLTGDGGSCGVWVCEEACECVMSWDVSVRELGGRVTLLCGVVVAEILQVNKPLRPESPADALTVHGQVDEVTWEEPWAQWVHNGSMDVFGCRLAWKWNHLLVYTLQGAK